MIKKNSLFKFSISILTTLLLISCQSSENKFYKDLDLPYMIKNDSLAYSGNYNVYIANSQKYLKIAEEKKYTDGKALYNLNMARMSINRLNYKKALTELNTAEQLLKSSDNKLYKAILYNMYSLLSNILSLKGAALEYNNRALNCLKKAPDNELKNKELYFSYINKAFVSLTGDSILSSYKKARFYEKETMLEAFISDYYIQMNKPDSAKVYLDNATALAQKLSFKDSRRTILYYVTARYLSSIQQDEQAKSYYLKALEMEKSTKETGAGLSTSIYQELIKYYNSKGDIQNENIYSEFYTKESTHINNRKNEAVPWVNQKFIMDMKNEEEDSHNNHSWIFISLFIIFILLVGYYTYKQIKKINHKKKLIKIETTKLVNKVSDKTLDNVIALAKKNDPTFTSAFREAFPEFFQKLYKLNPNLENSELTFCALLKLNFSSKEIANSTSVLHSSVQQRKRRLRRRLNIPGNIDLYTFFNNL
ncbi:hypothetical protein ELOC111193_15495 [Elizabethkingia occulta]|nr:hypothetical protein [Elizabethkingia occulta]